MVFRENKYLIYDTPKKRGVKSFAKKMVNSFQRLFYNILFLFIRPKKKEYMYNVSICAIFMNEAEYLKEWIEFHRIVGVEHFYLYNNRSSDNYLEILSPYIEKGLVTLKDWPKPQSQMSAYQDFIDNHSHETQWVGFIDLDELVVPNETDTIGEFLKGFINRPVVIIYWKCFGTSGYLCRNRNGLMAEDFVVSWPKCVDIGKYFFNTSYEYDQKYFRNRYMHSMYARYKGILLPPVNIFNKVCTFDNDPVSSGEMPIQINHYLLKSYDEYTEKKAKRGGGVNPVGIHDYSYFFQHEMKCCTTDYHAYKYLIKLKLAMREETTKTDVGRD